MKIHNIDISENVVNTSILSTWDVHGYTCYRHREDRVEKNWYD